MRDKIREFQNGQRLARSTAVQLMARPSRWLDLERMPQPEAAQPEAAPKKKRTPIFAFFRRVPLENEFCKE